MVANDQVDSVQTLITCVIFAGSLKFFNANCYFLQSLVVATHLGKDSTEVGMCRAKILVRILISLLHHLHILQVVQCHRKLQFSIINTILLSVEASQVSHRYCLQFLKFPLIILRSIFQLLNCLMHFLKRCNWVIHIDLTLRHAMTTSLQSHLTKVIAAEFR